MMGMNFGQENTRKVEKKKEKIMKSS